MAKSVKTTMVEIPEAVINDHKWCTRLWAEWFLCGPKMTNWKSGGLKDTLLDGMQWLAG